MPGRCWSVEREEIVRRDWPLGVDNATILGRVNSLPGPLISVYAMQRKAWALRVQRPADYIAAMNARNSAGHRGNPNPVPHRKTEAAPAPRVGPAPVPGKIPIYRPGFNPSIRFRDPAAASPEAIAAWIAERGVTRCPAAAVCETTAAIPAEDRAAIAAHQERLQVLLESAQWGGHAKRKAAARGARSVRSRQNAAVARQQARLGG